MLFVNHGGERLTTTTTTTASRHHHHPSFEEKFDVVHVVYAVQGGKLFEELAKKTKESKSAAWYGASVLCRTIQTSVVSRKGEPESLHLSEKCEQLRKIFQREMKKSAGENSKTKRETVLRIGVDGGGCAGFQYTFALIDEKGVVTGRGSVFVGRRFPEEAKVVCDEVSFEYLKGSTVDYAEEMIRSAFEVVKNPNAEQKSWSCRSFEAKF